MKILIADNFALEGQQIFEQTDRFEVAYHPGLSQEELLVEVADADALIVRGGTVVNEEVFAAAKQLKVVGRAGLSIENMDLAAANRKGVIVMNTPFGSTTTTAEHTIAMLLALARNIPAADASIKAGRWEKERYLGTEISGKTIGVIGAGKIGRLVVERLFELWGVERDFAIEVVDRLVDWVDTDDIKTGSGGAENFDYTKNGLRERPYNKRFRSLDEVLMVPGMEQIAARRPGWRDAFTLYSSGKLDLNEATPEALMAMFSASEETVQQFLEGRAGADGELYTSDDYRLQSVEEGLALLGSSGPEADAVANRLSVSDPVFRLVGIGRVNDMVVEQTVVISGREGNPKWIDHRQRRLR